MSFRIKSFLALSIAILFCSPPSYSQADQKSIAVKLYTNFLYTDTESSGIYSPVFQSQVTQRNKTIQSGYFTPSVSFSLPNGNNHEIELSRLLFHRSDYETLLEDDGNGQPGTMVEGGLTTDFLMAFRYEYNIGLMKKKDDLRIKPFIGFSADPYFSTIIKKYKISLTYPSMETRFGFTVSLIPRIVYNLGENWYLDFNVPVSLVDTYYLRERTDNPTLQLDQRTTATIEIHPLPARFQVRFGVGLRL